MTIKLPASAITQIIALLDIVYFVLEGKAPFECFLQMVSGTLKINFFLLFS